VPLLSPIQPSSEASLLLPVIGSLSVASSEMFLRSRKKLEK
jgi:hypothetical protein